MKVRSLCITLLVALLLAGGLSACGKKGGLEPPPSGEGQKENKYPRTYPAR